MASTEEDVKDVEDSKVEEVDLTDLLIEREESKEDDQLADIINVSVKLVGRYVPPPK